MTKQRSWWNAGQALVLVVAALPLFFSVCALVIDGTNLMVHRRTMQNAADASALAASQELGPATAAAELCAGDAACLAGVRATFAPRVAAAAADYSGQNGGPSSVHECGSANDTNCYMWPYKGSYGLVEVRLQRSIDGLIAGLAGVNSLFDVAARAVASTQPVTNVTTTPGSTDIDPGTTYTTTTTTGGSGAVAFTKSTDCAGAPGGASIQWSGAPSQISALLTNGGIEVTGNAAKFSAHIGLGKYDVPSCRRFFGAPASPNFPDVTGPFAWMDYPVPPPDPAPPAGCVNPGTTTISSATWVTSHPPGVYCLTTGTLTISVNGGSFIGYTFFAPSINVSSNGQTFVHATIGPGERPVAFDAYSGNFVLDGQDNSITGDIYAPVGNISIAGGSGEAGVDGRGLMESLKLMVSGNFANFEGTGPTVGGTTTTTTTTVPGHTVIDPGSTVTATVGTLIGLDE